jgi:predicted metalloprotease with PDZ domain
MPGVRYRYQIMRKWIATALGTLLLSLQPIRSAAETVISLDVDATELPRKIVTAHLVIPAKPGPLTLSYPQWVPGAHGPLGPVRRLAGLKLSVAGKPIPWQRDTLDLFAFHCDVPAGGTAVDAELLYVMPSQPEHLEVSLGIVGSAKLGIINWNALLLSPKGQPAEDVKYAARLHLPPGWRCFTALPAARESSTAFDFQAVPMPQLVDSPVLAGVHLRSLPLRLRNDLPHEIDVAAENEAELQIPNELVTSFTRMTAEAGALFGSRHYPNFRFLLALSDRIPPFGLEHPACSVNSASPRALGNDAGSRWWLTFLLPHEYTHSWNGKYRRPADMVTRDYSQPQQMDLLWVYEGLTQYIGLLLDARSGLWPAEQFRAELASSAASLDHATARAWRPLLDTAIAAPLHASVSGRSWRGISDYYYEMVFVWLEADVLIRQKTGGKRTLDDFCKSFFGGTGGTTGVKPYTADDVFRSLNEIVSHDWRAFFNTRLASTSAHPPLDGLKASGWRLIYDDSPPAGSRSRGSLDLSHALGFLLAEDGTITEVLYQSDAWKAGLRVGMRILAINSRRWAPAVLHAAMKARKTGGSPCDFLIEDGEQLRTYAFAYRDGEKYPHLQRDSSRTDVLEQILRPLSRP